MLSLNLIQYFYEDDYLQTLEETAKRLGSNSSKLKTKIRRLYDITNVFKSLGLIRKATTIDKKIAIEWQGNYF